MIGCEITNQVALWPVCSPWLAVIRISWSRQLIRWLYGFMLTRIGCEINLVFEKTSQVPLWSVFPPRLAGKKLSCSGGTNQVVLWPDCSPECDKFHARATNQVVLWPVCSLGLAVKRISFKRQPIRLLYDQTAHARATNQVALGVYAYQDWLWNKYRHSREEPTKWLYNRTARR
jgi:hypothetical protein